MAGEAGADKMAIIEHGPRPQQNPDHHSNNALKIGAAITAAAITVGGVAEAAHLGVFGNADSTPQPGHTQVLEGGMPSANLPITTETPVATTTATATPEAKKEVPCVIFSPDVCAKYPGETFTDPDIPGRIFIGFNLPKGTKIFADRNGLMQSGNNADFHAPTVVLTGENKSFVVITGDILATKQNAGGSYEGSSGNGNISLNTKENDQTATVQDTGKKIKDKFNVVVNFGTIDTKGNYATDNTTMQAEFPNIMLPTTK